MEWLRTIWLMIASMLGIAPAESVVSEEPVTVAVAEEVAVEPLSTSSVAAEEEGVEDESFRRMRDRDSSEEDREGVEEVELKNKIRCRRH